MGNQTDHQMLVCRKIQFIPNYSQFSEDTAFYRAEIGQSTLMIPQANKHSAIQLQNI